MTLDSQGLLVKFVAFGAVVALEPSARSQGCPPVERVKVMASDETPHAFFGAPSLSGQSVLIAAAFDDAAGAYAGSAYVFVRSGTNWVEQAKLLPNDGEAFDTFGAAISLSGDTALIGAPGDDDKGADSGSAYVFVRNGTTWTQQAKLVAPTGKAEDRLGRSVSLSGDTALVGAPNDDDLDYDAGAVYVYTRFGTNWSPTAKLLANDGLALDRFGSSVSLSGTTALIGSPTNDEKGQDSGAAYIFVRNGMVWTQQAKLVASDGKFSHEFGCSTSLAGALALVGAPDACAAYVFVRNGTDWSEQAKLSASNAGANDSFGYAVALSENALASDSSATALVGAPSHTGPAPWSGGAYLFVQNGTDWVEIAALTASDGALDDSFGAAVSLDRNTALIGAARVDGTSGSDVGAAYSFGLQSAPSPISYCTAKPGLVCGPPAIQHSGLPSATATAGFVITAKPALTNRIGVFLYSDGGRASIPFQGGTLCVAPPIHRSVPVSSGGSVNCTGIFSIDWNRYAHGLLGGSPQPFLLVPGQQINVQMWGRDSVATGSLLSDALEYFPCE